MVEKKRGVQIILCEWLDESAGTNNREIFKKKMFYSILEAYNLKYVCEEFHFFNDWLVKNIKEAIYSKSEVDNWIKEKSLNKDKFSLWLDERIKIHKYMKSRLDQV